MANHEALFGVLPALMQERIELPKSLSLVGFEDVNWFHDWHPPLTVIDFDAAAMAEATFELLFPANDHTLRRRPAPRHPQTRPVAGPPVDCAERVKDAFSGRGSAPLTLPGTPSW